MFNQHNLHYKKPKNHQDFETFCSSVFRGILYEFDTQKNKPNWSGQDGVDIFGYSDEYEGYVGIQCKKIDPDSKNNKLTKSVVRKEVGMATRFSPKLKAYVIITTGDIDKSAYEEARIFSEKNKKLGGFFVVLWDWDEFLEYLISKGVDVDKYYPNALRTTLLRTNSLIVLMLAIVVSVLVVVYKYSDVDLNKAVSVFRQAKKGATPPGFKKAVSVIRKNNISLSQEELSGAIFECQDLSALDMRRAHGDTVHGTGAVFDASKMSYVYITRSEMNATSFRGASLYGAHFDESNMLASDLTGVDARYSSFTSVTLNQAMLKDSHFDGADMTNINLSGADLTNSVFVGSDMTNANLDDAVVTGADFRKVKGLSLKQIRKTCVVGNKDPITDFHEPLNLKQCYTNEGDKDKRYVLYKTIQIVGMMTIMGGYCDNGKVIVRNPSLPGKQFEPIYIQ